MDKITHVEIGVHASLLLALRAIDDDFEMSIIHKIIYPNQVIYQEVPLSSFFFCLNINRELGDRRWFVCS